MRKPRRSATVALLPDPPHRWARAESAPPPPGPHLALPHIGRSIRGDIAQSQEDAELVAEGSVGAALARLSYARCARCGREERAGHMSICASLESRRGTRVNISATSSASPASTMNC